MRYYNNYNKEELVKKINNISITQNDAGQVVTKYQDRVVSVSNVSAKYEIFDIKKYLIDKIELIEKNFDILKYDFLLKGGIQSLTLLSDVIEIEGIKFHKSFFILNSSDKSRRLSFNIGLYSVDKNIYIVNSVKSIGLTKKHLRGVTKAAEIASLGLNDETFNEQIESIKSLIGHRISLSKLKDIIVPDSDVKSNHLKFDAFKNSIIYFKNEGRLTLDNKQYQTLRTPSDKLVITRENDFYVDAFWAFQTYLRLFNRQDSHIIKKETEKILNITQWAVRNSQLELLGI
jgi:hypothetical protein